MAKRSQKTKTFPKIAGTLYAGHFKAKGNVEVHAHPELELILVSRGTCRCRIGSLPETTATAGKCFVIPPRVPHDQSGDCDTFFVTLNVPKEEIPDAPELLDLSSDNFACRIFEELVSLFRRAQIRECETLAGALWSRLYCGKLKAGSRISTSAVYTDIAVDYIHRHYRDPIGVKDLAHAAKISAAHLNRFFRSEYSVSTMQYLYNWRLAIALQLLDSPYLTVAEIADECGFSSANYFVRAFKKKYGTTPGEFRKSQKAEQ